MEPVSATDGDLASSRAQGDTEIETQSLKRNESFVHVDKTGKLACTVKALYAMPQFASTSVSFLISVYGNRFYSQVGASLAFLSFFTALARSADVMTDPLMGWWSDNTRGTVGGISGRRRPYMAYGAPFYALFLFLLFCPPLGAVSSYWFGAFYVVFFLFDTFANVPNNALGPELTDDYDERSLVFLYSKLVNFMGMLAAAGGPAFLAYMMRPYEEVKIGCSELYQAGNSSYAIPSGTNKCSVSNGDLCYETGGEYFQVSLDLLDRTCVEGTALVEGYANMTMTIFKYSAAELEVTRTAMMITALLFGLWYTVATAALVAGVQERPVSVSTSNPPLIPCIMRCFKNTAFRPLLLGWFFDGIALAALTSTGPFFIEYVVIPNGKKAQEHWTAMSTDYCMGFSMFGLLVGAMVSMPLWLKVSQTIGKYHTWLSYVVLNALLNILFIIPEEGWPGTTILLFTLNGIPLGGQFLVQSILADVITYDEFLNGCRSEGIFSVFQSLIPKFVAIPASALPLAIINMLGFLPPVDGVAQPQSDSVKLFVRLTFAVLPVLCLCVGIVAKLYFPIRTKEMNIQIAEGIIKHNAGEAAVDPITGEMCELLVLTEKEASMVWTYENFHQDDLQALLKDRKAHPIQCSMSILVAIGVALVAVLMGMVGGTFTMLEDAALSIIPLLSVIFLGMAICFLAVNVLRYVAAKDIPQELDLETVKLLEKLIEHKSRGQRAGTVKKHDSTNPSVWSSLFGSGTAAKVAPDNAAPAKIAPQNSVKDAQEVTLVHSVSPGGSEMGSETPSTSGAES